MNSAAAGSHVAFALFSASLLIGCVDARSEFDDYSSRLVDANDTMIDGEVVSVLPDIDGEWLLAVRPNLPDDKIIQFRTTFALTPVTENTAKVDLSAQPLDFEVQTPVGDPIATVNQDVGSDARFVAPLVGQLPGRANPVTMGDVPINATMYGELRSADFLCGTMTGTASSLPLEGTTWAAVRITGDELPEYVVNCDAQPQ